MNKPFSLACKNNQQPILTELLRILRHCKTVLEIGSGTGQHAAWFAPNLPWLRWQPSDLSDKQVGLLQWLDDVPSKNLQRPIVLDVMAEWPSRKYDAVYSANTTHILSWEGVEALITGAFEILNPKGILCLYGPFKSGHTALEPSNLNFDLSLKSTSVHRGLREIEALDGLAKKIGLLMLNDLKMPSHNRLLIWQKTR